VKAHCTEPISLLPPLRALKATPASSVNHE